MRHTSRARIALGSLIGLGLGSGLLWALMPKPVEVQTAMVHRGPLEITLDHEGVTRVREPYVVSAPVAGQLLRISLEPGDPVVENKTIVATMHPTAPLLLDVRTRTQVAARVRVARANLASANANAQGAREALVEAKRELERTRRLRESDAVSQAALDRTDTNVRQREAALDASKDAARAARYDLQVARAALATQDGTTASDPSLPIESPVTGVVLERYHESAEVVPPGQPLLRLANRDNLEVASDYLSTDAVKIRPGMAVHIDGWGQDEKLRGRVRRVEPAGFTKVSALGVEEQRVWVVVEFEQPSRAWQSLGDAYRVETRVVVWRNDGVLQVPMSALFRRGNRWAVFVVHDGRAELRSVAIGASNSLSAHVRSGLSAGQKVIVHPPSSLTDGTRISE